MTRTKVHLLLLSGLGLERCLGARLPGGDLAIHEFPPLNPLGAQPVVAAAEHPGIALVVAAEDGEGPDVLDLQTRSLPTADPGASAVLAALASSLEFPLQGRRRHVTRRRRGSTRTVDPFGSPWFDRLPRGRFAHDGRIV